MDSGCTQTIISKKLFNRTHDVAPIGQEKVVTVDGSVVTCPRADINLLISHHSIVAECLVLDTLISEFDLILGMDVIQRLGGMTLGGADDTVHFGLVASEVRQSMTIEDVDFSAQFDGFKWTVRWKWAGEEPHLVGRVSDYGIKEDLRPQFEKEVELWIKEDILVPVPDDQPADSVIPIMAILQESKGKVRPVLDFQRLNEFVSCHTGGSDACDDAIRRWRKMGSNVALLDLKKAYLQLHVHSDLWKHQVISFKGRKYYLTRLGFGLNSAPRIMGKILKTVLSLDKDVLRGTDNYLDDILVDEIIVSADRVKQHLSQYGLVAKIPENVAAGAKVLGLSVNRGSESSLFWKRGNVLSSPQVSCSLTRRELFSICGQLVGHHPVAGRLRVACGFIKRACEGRSWDDYVGDDARRMLGELLDELQSFDPVCGRWDANSKSGRIWCDASSLAIGCALEIEGHIMEDAAWLRKKNDGAHINMAELDSVLRGLNLAVKWKLEVVEVITDSATVFGWLKSSLFESGTIKTRGMNEMLVRRRLAVVRDICNEFEMKVSVRWIESHKNKADCLTRVSKRWLSAIGEVKDACFAASANSVEDDVRLIHNHCHLGIDRTMYLARKRYPSVTRSLVEKVVKRCTRCCSIDPAPVSWEKGSLEVQADWTRLATDITHFNGMCYLSIIDCGPSRFAIWRKLRDESAESVVSEMLQVFRENGPPEELLMDNGKSFRSSAMAKLLDAWKVRAVFRCAYRPTGNSIVERHHRTIKRMAARANGDPLDMVFFYNVTPKEGIQSASLPSSSRYRYEWRIPCVAAEVLQDPEKSEFKVGDRVFVKPPSGRCTVPWSLGVISGEQTAQRVEVDGVPRHVADLRSVPKHQPIDSAEEEDGESQLSSERPKRIVRRPDFFGHNIYDF